MGWKSLADLGLEGEKAAQWSKYMNMLKSNFIYLRKEESDTLCWSKNPLNGQYTTKLGMGYLSLADATFGRSKWWWWESG
jgi:hypothetical protein